MGGVSTYYVVVQYVCQLLFLAYIQRLLKREQDDPVPLIKVTKSNQCPGKQRY